MFGQRHYDDRFDGDDRTMFCIQLGVERLIFHGLHVDVAEDIAISNR